MPARLDLFSEDAGQLRVCLLVRVGGAAVIDDGSFGVWHFPGLRWGKRGRGTEREIVLGFGEKRELVSSLSNLTAVRWCAVCGGYLGSPFGIVVRVGFGGKSVVSGRRRPSVRAQ